MSGVIKRRIALNKLNLQKTIASAEAILHEELNDQELVTKRGKFNHIKDSISAQVSRLRQLQDDLNHGHPDEAFCDDQENELEDLLITAENLVVQLQSCVDSANRFQQEQHEHEVNLEKARSLSALGSIQARSKCSSIASLYGASQQGQDCENMSKEVELLPNEEETTVKMIDAGQQPDYKQASEMLGATTKSVPLQTGNVRQDVSPTQALPQLSQAELYQFRQFLNRNQGSNFSQPTQGNSSKPVVKLPKLEIQKFDGDPTHWNRFWDSFRSSVHFNPNLAQIDKFNYLMTFLDNKVKKVLGGLELCDKNYVIAIDKLTERYGNQRIVVSTLYENLQNLKFKGTDKQNLRDFVDEMEALLLQLESQRQVTESPIIVDILAKKLPEELIIRFGDKLVDEEQWTVETIRRNLKQYLKSVELVRKFEKSEKDEKQRTNVTTARTQRPWHPTAEALAITVRKQSKGPENSGQDSIERSKNPTGYCVYCGKPGHFHDQCKEIPDANSRKQKLYKDSRCMKCTSKGHTASQCPKKEKPCFHCKKSNHHSSICWQRFPSLKRQEEVTEATNKNLSTLIVQPNKSISNCDYPVLMQTAKGILVNPDNPKKMIKVQIVFDSGSQQSYLAHHVVHQLKLMPVSIRNVSIGTFGSLACKNRRTALVKVNLQLKDGSSLSMRVNDWPCITHKIHKTAVPPEIVNIPQDLLADGSASESEEFTADMLIGLDYISEILNGNPERIVGNLFATDSMLGVVIHGSYKNEEDLVDENTALSLFVHQHMSNNEDHLHRNPTSWPTSSHNLDDLWSLELLGIRDSEFSKDDERAQNIFDKSVQFENQRYAVTWPWKEDARENLPTNFNLAFYRLRSTVKRLSDSPEILKKYELTIQEQLEKGIIELAPKIPDGTVHYLPHHAVITPSKSTTKVRIVYDASAKVKGAQSLNDCLFRGRIMLEDLVGQLLRFRMNEIVLLADIEKAFLQIELQLDQRDVCRFLWVEKPEGKEVTEENLLIYRFKRVPFGVVSSPYLLSATIEHHLQKYKCEAAKQILGNIYVDNVIVGMANVESAKTFYNTAKKLFQDASMNLREWSSNSKATLESIPEIDVAKGIVQKVLGISWNTEEDNICIAKQKSETEMTTVTKREVLKQTARIFDPLGLFSPVLLKAKLFLQRLWTEQLKWDEPLSQDELQEWKEIESLLLPIHAVKVCRFVVNTPGSNKLVAFVDASQEAYAAVIYIVNERNACLVFAKSRLSPQRKLTIPRMELMAVWLGVKCMRYVEKELRQEFTERVLWSDSQCVLHWLKSEKPLSVFVQNRVMQIKNLGIPDLKLKYISSHENPADLGTHGKNVSDLNDSIWWTGPKWLTNEAKWPTGELPYLQNFTEDKINSEAKKPKPIKTLAAIMVNNIESALPFDYKRFSNLMHLLRVTVWCLRFKTKRKGPITSEEIHDAKHRWELAIQKLYFKEVFESIEMKKPNDLTRSLGLRVDEKTGILRCHGRYENADLPHDTICPKLLPRGDKYTELVIKQLHAKLLHAGTAQTLGQLRYQYWVPQGRREVSKIIRSCVVCKRFEGGPFKMPRMAPWPKPRICRSRPFSYIGLDYLGPLYVRTKQNESKTWICLFTCMATRAVHLELVVDLSAESFLNCLIRFISMYGKPIEIVCDNAPSFKLVKSTMEIMWNRVVKDESVLTYIANEGIKWKFIVEFAPWMGGFYERLIGLTKRALRKTIGKRILTFEKLRTIVTQTAAIINTRPLTYVGDFDSGIPLTPAHFISFGGKLGIPQDDDFGDPEFEPSPTGAQDLEKMWQKGQRLLDEFWNRWEAEYLLSLRERKQIELKQGRICSHLQPEIGDVVILKEKAPRGVWKMAKIIELITSQDGNIRSAKIKLPNRKVLRRPLSELCPLEVSSTSEESNGSDNEQSQLQPARVTRTSARKAMEKISQQLTTKLQ